MRLSLDPENKSFHTGDLPNEVECDGAVVPSALLSCAIPSASCAIPSEGTPSRPSMSTSASHIAAPCSRGTGAAPGLSSGFVWACMRLAAMAWDWRAGGS